MNAAIFQKAVEEALAAALTNNEDELECPSCDDRVLITINRRAMHVSPVCAEWAEYMENWEAPGEPA